MENFIFCEVIITVRSKALDFVQFHFLSNYYQTNSNWKKLPKKQKHAKQLLLLLVSFLTVKTSWNKYQTKAKQDTNTTKGI